MTGYFRAIYPGKGAFGDFCQNLPIQVYSSLARGGSYIWHLNYLYPVTFQTKVVVIVQMKTDFHTKICLDLEDTIIACNEIAPCGTAAIQS